MTTQEILDEMLKPTTPETANVLTIRIGDDSQSFNITDVQTPKSKAHEWCSDTSKTIILESGESCTLNYSGKCLRIKLSGQETKWIKKDNFKFYYSGITHALNIKKGIRAINNRLDCWFK